MQSQHSILLQIWGRKKNHHRNTKHMMLRLNMRKLARLFSSGIADQFCSALFCIFFSISLFPHFICWKFMFFCYFCEPHVTTCMRVNSKYCACRPIAFSLHLVHAFTINAINLAVSLLLFCCWFDPQFALKIALFNSTRTFKRVCVCVCKPIGFSRSMLFYAGFVNDTIEFGTLISLYILLCVR